MLNFYEGHKVYMNGLYPAVYLNGKNQHIHRLEWIKHHGEIPADCIVHHKDQDKTNWNIENLELLKRADHVKKHQANLHSENFIKRGEESRHHVLSQADVDFIKSHYVKYDRRLGGRSLAKHFGVTDACISAIVNGKNWKEVV